MWQERITLWRCEGGKKTEHFPPAQISTHSTLPTEIQPLSFLAAELWQKMLTQIYFPQSNIIALREAVRDVFFLWSRTCVFRPPEPSFLPFLPGATTYISIQPSNETSSPTCMCGLPFCLKAPWLIQGVVSAVQWLLTAPPVRGHCEHTGVFSHGITLTQAPLIPLGCNVIAT